MTISLTRPGCFGSALFYRVDAPECSACAIAAECSKSAQDRMQDVLGTVERLDASFDLQRAPSVANWIKGRWKRDTAKERKSKSARATLDSWKADGLNVYELRHKMNPALPSEPVLRTTFALIIESGAGFTRRDITDELYQACLEEGPLTKAGAKRQVDTVVDALLEAGVLKTESRGILCLN